MADFIIRGELEKIDPKVNQIIELEKERQNRKLIFIPSESSAPAAVRESLGSVLQNIYAEGYPPEESRSFSESEILDIENQLLDYRRYSDPRYYKGVEFADILEELARRRCAEVFATEHVAPEDIFVNVQPLSGAPANNAVYTALIEPGDPVLGMSLFHGGHLTHGSSVNRSGKLYNVSHYSVDPESEKIDYKQVYEIAVETKPRIIIAGYSSYPWMPDWAKFREISDAVGAYLFCDISHIAGLIAGKAVPSPIGYADIITFTTHKTLCGPRGACILSFDEKLSRKIDRAVFPGEQGGPHIQVFSAMATTFKLAKTKDFSQFQKQIIDNCVALSNQLEKRGLRIAYGGTNTHLTNIDCKSIIGKDGTPLSGDMVARILDLAGMVTNANTIPGDKSTFRASGVRLGTPWLTQRGLVEKDMIDIADLMADILHQTQPYSITSGNTKLTRAKVDFNAFEEGKIRTREIISRTKDYMEYTKSGYPFFHYIDDFDNRNKKNLVTFSCSGQNMTVIMNYILPADVEKMESGIVYKTNLFVSGNDTSCYALKKNKNEFMIAVPGESAGMTAEWLRGLSDGFIQFDDDLSRRIPGPFMVKESKEDIDFSKAEDINDSDLPFFIGIQPDMIEESGELPKFEFSQEETETKKTVLNGWHVQNDAKMIPFAGWEMPVWYSSVLEEHLATRNDAGLFDVTHMGIFQAEDPFALPFLESVCANDISKLNIGESCYTHFLDVDAKVIDDLIVYRHEEEKYMLVVNAANEKKDWEWLSAVQKAEVRVDNLHPDSRAYGTKCILKNLKASSSGKGMRVDIALQGPKSIDVLLSLNWNKNDKEKILELKKTELCHADWERNDIIVSRTGYTGEKWGFELFVHPDSAVDLWASLIDKGEAFGLRPCGLGARDSLRTEAGLPLYGHEMGGELNLGVGDAGFDLFVKTYKPWFIGRAAYIQEEKKRKSVVARFRFDEKNVRLAHLGDPVFNEKGKVIGTVTSCAIDRLGSLTGQAYIQEKYSKEGSEIYIYQQANELEPINLGKISAGEKIQMPNKAIILKRFARF